MRALILATLLLAASATADAAPWVAATIYFRGWYVLNAINDTPQSLRRAPQGYVRRFHVTSARKLQELVTLLDLSRLRPLRGDFRGDTALVIDLFDQAGACTTYRADNRYLWTADCKRGREIDGRFRKYFETFTP